MVRSFSDFEANLTSVERIQEYCDLPQEVYNLTLDAYNCIRIK